MGSDLALFYLFAGVAVVASLLVVGQKNPMYSVLLLIVSFAALAALYLQLDSPLAAVVQIIIYAGAIMVVFLFVVMLLNAGREDVPEGLARPESPHGPRLAGAALAVVLAAELVVALWMVALSSGVQQFGDPASVATTVGSIRAIGRSLFTEHTFAFEATSVLVLVAMLGAVVLAKRKVE